jgi:hypothetical protein
VNLGARYWRFSRKAAWLAAAFAQAATAPIDPACDSPHLLARENATIFLQDQWSAFCRDLVYSSWRGAVVTMGGQVLPRRPGARSDHAALLALRTTYSGKQKRSPNWEPKWFDPLETIEAAKRLSVPNLRAIALGVGLTPSPLDELRAVRNYFAHRGRQSTARLAPYAGSPVTGAAAHALLRQRSLGGSYRFEEWVAELDIMARAAVE